MLSLPRDRIGDLVVLADARPCSARRRRARSLGTGGPPALARRPARAARAAPALRCGHAGAARRRATNADVHDLLLGTHVIAGAHRRASSACLISGEERRRGRSTSLPVIGETSARRRAEPRSTRPRRLDCELDRHARSTLAFAVAERIARTIGEPTTGRADHSESGLCLRDTRHEVRAGATCSASPRWRRCATTVSAFACDVVCRRPARGAAVTMREPVRLVAAITPFNHPLNQVAHKVAPAIAGGSADRAQALGADAAHGALAGSARSHEAGCPPDAASRS